MAIDGKVLRHPFDTAKGKSALHLVSAWASANHLLLGQCAVDEKSNEITAIPELLKLLDLRGALVTIDAMGCQKKIAADIVAAGADYVLAVKENQPGLYADVERVSLDGLEDDFGGHDYRYHRTVGEGHGRKEVRHYHLLTAPAALAGARRLRRAEDDRHGLQRAAGRRRAGGRRGALLHQQPAAAGEGVRRGGARALVHREPPARQLLKQPLVRRLIQSLP